MDVDVLLCERFLIKTYYTSLSRKLRITNGKHRQAASVMAKLQKLYNVTRTESSSLA